MPISQKLVHDFKIDIATGRDRNTKTWKNKRIHWSALVEKISQTHRTAESYADYLTAKKPRQDEIKDIGGFVGGYLVGGRRKTGSVQHRQLITLDADFAGPDFWSDFQMMFDCSAAIYSTHKHAHSSPRYRLLIPLDREVAADEYVAICRKVADSTNINYFDPTGFRPTQLMYWPSTSRDGEYVFEYQDGPWLSADQVLESYRNWQDSSEWPMGDREKEMPLRAMKKQGDPLEKPGVVGAFCRTYTISSAIDTFLTDEYETCDQEDRYTYKQGSTGGGLVVYEDKYAFSHHGSDPVSGKLCNAFDLVRIHKFGLRDEDAREDTPSNRLPSYLAMIDFAVRDKATSKAMSVEKLDEMRSDFSEDLEEFEAETGEKLDDEWAAGIEKDRNGNTLNTIDNVVLILRNDPMLKDRIRYNDFEKMEVAVKHLPWRKVTRKNRHLEDADDAALRHYLEKYYGITAGNKITDGLNIVVRERAFHPIQDYIKSVSWDGSPRLDTMLIDYLGAEDNLYTRTVTRKSLVAAVARIFDPGCKYDTMPILVGDQGIGKSTIIAKLGGEWFSDSFNFHMLNKPKQAEEQLQGAWLMEIGEMTGMNKADLESAKSFLSRTEDRYRIAYGKRLAYFPRQSTFWGSANNDRPLRDTTGGRRFWPVVCRVTRPLKNVFTDLYHGEIDQIWAETYQTYLKGEALHLSEEVEALAKLVQADHTETDDRIGLIQDYLDTPLPENWDGWDLPQRKNYLKGDEEIRVSGEVQKNQVCAAEIWCEVLGGTSRDMNRSNTKFIHEIMQKMPGWEGAKSNRVFSLYGVQRAYTRINTVLKEDFL